MGGGRPRGGPGSGRPTFDTDIEWLSVTLPPAVD